MSSSEILNNIPKDQNTFEGADVAWLWIEETDNFECDRSVLE